MSQVNIDVYNNEEILLRNLLRNIDKKKVKSIISDYIKEQRLHVEYIDLITELNKDYIEKSNFFIERFKRDVNALYVDENFGKNVMKNVDIDEKNWFWYARLLRDTEDEQYPKNNFFTPKYLLERLKPIIAKLNASKLEKDQELYELYRFCLNLISKYKLIGGES